MFSWFKRKQVVCPNCMKGTRVSSEVTLELCKKCAPDNILIRFREPTDREYVIVGLKGHAKV